MKKILGIIAALALATAVFADPDVTPSVAAFNGAASIEYQVDLDNKAFGIANATPDTEFTIQFVATGDKTTSGDGLWGELKIDIGDDPVKVSGPNNAFNVPTVRVATAKIHFTDDDFYANMNILVPGLSLGGGDILLATKSNGAFPGASVSIDDKAGFTLNFGLKDVVDFNLQYADNGVKPSDAKQYGFVFDVSLKAVENLNFNAAAGYGTKAKQFVASAKLDYKLGLTDDLYLLPAVGFSLDEAKAKKIAGGLLFGWGGTGIEANFASFSTGVKNVENNCADGVSVYLEKELADNTALAFRAGAFDSKFLGDFGIKIGAQLVVADLANFGKTAGDAFDAAIAFSKTFDIWTIDANAGCKFTLDTSKFGALYGFGISTDNSIIENTKLYLTYSGEHAADVNGADLKGKIVIGAKIHF